MEKIFIPQATSSLAVWLYYIERLHIKPIDLGLDRINHVASGLGLKCPAFRVITVGGTNGKGTTCRLLEAIFLAEGLQVGVYSSPHLLRYTERVRVQGKELTESAHSEAMAIIERGRCGISLSYFEFATLSALQLFCQKSLDVVILEVGLGGRLDATNIVDTDIAVITSIALDHTDWLGPDRSSIAREKAGIMRFGKPIVVGEPDRPSTLDEAVASCGAILFARERDWGFQIEENGWRWWDRKIELRGLPFPVIPLDNAATALAAVRCFPFDVSERSIRQSLRDAALPGRFQILYTHPIVIFDVAHNPHAADYLARRLAMLSPFGKIRAVVGMLADKDIPGTLACLRERVQVWYCATLKGARGASAAQLAGWIDNKNALQFDAVENAWLQAMADSSPEDYVLVFGSFYTVAAVMALVERENQCVGQ